MTTSAVTSCPDAASAKCWELTSILVGSWESVFLLWGENTEDGRCCFVAMGIGKSAGTCPFPLCFPC